MVFKRNPAALYNYLLFKIILVVKILVCSVCSLADIFEMYSFFIHPVYKLYKNYSVHYCTVHIHFTSLTFPCQQWLLVPTEHRPPFSNLKQPAALLNNAEYLSLVWAGEIGDETDLWMQPCVTCLHSQYYKLRSSDNLNRKRKPY